MSELKKFGLRSGENESLNFAIPRITMFFGTDVAVCRVIGARLQVGCPQNLRRPRDD